MGQTKESGGQQATPVEAVPLPNITDIQAMLWENVLHLREGKMTPSNANAVSNSVGKMFTAVKLQMEYAKLVGVTPNIPFLLTSR